LFLCAGIVMELPQAIGGAFELHRRGMMSTNQVLGMAILAVLLVAAAAFVEGARRKVAVTFAGREGRAGASYLSFRLNGAGIMPAQAHLMPGGDDGGPVVRSQEREGVGGP